MIVQCDQAKWGSVTVYRSFDSFLEHGCFIYEVVLASTFGKFQQNVVWRYLSGDTSSFGSENVVGVLWRFLRMRRCIRSIR